MIDPHTGLDINIKTHNPNLKQSPAPKAPKAPALPKATELLASGTLSGKNFQSNTLDESKYNQNISPFDVQQGRLTELRAQNQPWHHEMANSAIQLGAEVLSGGLETFGYMAELAQGNVLAVENDNLLIKLGEQLRDATQENFQIHNANPGGFMFDSSENFFQTMVSLGSTLALMLPTVGGAKALGWAGKLLKNTSRGKRAFAAIDKITPGFLATESAKYTMGGIAQAGLSRHLENNMNASETYKSLLEQGVSKEEAMKAAEEVYTKNWAMIAQDIPQYLAFGRVFNPITKSFDSGLKNFTKNITKSKVANAALGLAGTSASEAFEEAYQFVIGKEAEYGAKVRSGLVDAKQYDERMREYFDDAEFWNSVAMGALGGAVFQSIGGIGKNKKIAEANKKYENYRNGAMKKLLHNQDVADTMGNEELAIDSRKRANMDMVHASLLTDNFDAHVEYLEAMQNMSAEEQAIFENEHGITLNEEIIKKIVPELIEDSYKMRDSYLKNSNKYGTEVASLIAYNELDRSRLAKQEAELSDVVAELKQEVPGFDDMTSFGQELYTLKADKYSLTHARKIKLAEIANDPSLNQQEKDKAIKQVESGYNSAIANLDAKFRTANPEDTRTEEEKKADSVLTNAFDINENNGTNSSIAYAKAKGLQKRIKQKRQELDKEYQYLTSSKAQRDVLNNKNRQSITNTESLDELRELGSTLRKDGQFSTVKEDYRNREKELVDKIKKEIEPIVDEVMRLAEAEGTSFESQVKKMPQAQRSIIDKYKSEFWAFLDSKNNKKATKENKTSTRKKTEIDELKENAVYPLNVDVERNDVEQWAKDYNDWLAAPVDYTGYTAVITIDKENKFDNQDALMVTFKDKNGNVAEINGRTVKTYFANKSIKDHGLALDIKALRERVKKDGTVYLKVKGQAPVNETKGGNANNNIQEVFGDDTQILFTDGDGNYRTPENPDAPMAVGKTTGNSLKGEFFATTTDNRGRKRAIKINRPTLAEVPGAVDLVYKISEFYLQEPSNFKRLDTSIPMEWLEQVEIPVDIIKSAINKKGDLTYRDVLEFFIYQGNETFKSPKNAFVLNRFGIRYGQQAVRDTWQGERKVKGEIIKGDTLTPENILKFNSTQDETDANNADTIENVDGKTVRLIKGSEEKLISVTLKSKAITNKLENAGALTNENVKQHFINFIGTKRFNIRVPKSDIKKVMDYYVAENLLRTEKEKGKIFMKPSMKEGLEGGGQIYFDKGSMGNKDNSKKVTPKKATPKKPDTKVSQSDLDAAEGDTFAEGLMFSEGDLTDKEFQSIEQFEAETLKFNDEFDAMLEQGDVESAEPEITIEGENNKDKMTKTTEKSVSLPEGDQGFGFMKDFNFSSMVKNISNVGKSIEDAKKDCD